jgi:hypothetical protein
MCSTTRCRFAQNDFLGKEEIVAIRNTIGAVLFLPAFLSGSSSAIQQASSIRHVTIVATDYAYQVPPVVPSGMTAFRFVNRGTHPHEVQLFRFLPSVSAKAARAYLVAGNVPDSAADSSGSVLIALPEVTAQEEVLIPLVRGERYALMCEFRDDPSKPKHTMLGMVALLEVRP